MVGVVACVQPGGQGGGGGGGRGKYLRRTATQVKVLQLPQVCTCGPWPRAVASPQPLASSVRLLAGSWLPWWCPQGAQAWYRPAAQ